MPAADLSSSPATSAPVASRPAAVVTRSSKLGIAVVALMTAVVVSLDRSELPRGVHAAGRVGVWWLLALIAVTALGLLALVIEHTAAQRAADLRPRRADVAPLALAARFTNSVAKSGGLAGLAVFRASARRKGQPVPRVVAAYLLVAVLDMLAFAVILATAVAVLAVTRRFQTGEALASAVFAIYLAVLLAALAAATQSRSAVRRLCAVPGNVARRLTWRRRRAEGRPDHTAADELFDAIAVVRRRPAAAVPAALAALAIDVVGVAQLWLVLHALGMGATVTVALVSYGLSTLFGIVGFLPGGLGFVELSLGAVLVSFGTAAGVAAATVVLYRLFEFWLPVVVGGLALRRVGRGASTP